MFKRKKIGLALGGGGARGLAHIGVLKVLEDYKIPIDMIAGTSMGAVIGALYSAEPNAKKLAKEARASNWKDLFDYTISKSGLIKGKKIEEFLEKKLDQIKFNELKIPLYVTAFDLDQKREIVFSKGNVAKAVRASISIPGIFIPVQNKGEIIVDGGVTDIIPTEALRKAKADIIIAINVDSLKEKSTLYGQKADSKETKKKIPNLINTITRSLQVIESEACKSEILNEKADLVISPNLEKIGTFDFQKAKQAIKIGERKARISIEEIKKLVEPNIFKEFLKDLEKEFSLEKVIEKVGVGDVKKILKTNIKLK